MSASVVGDISRSDVITISPDASVADASRLMVAEGVDHLPVVDDGGRLVGMFTRTDVLKAIRPVLAAETREAGWLQRRRQV